MNVNKGPLETGQFRIDEILGQKVNPVEAQVFETRKSRVRLLFGLVIWGIATLLLSVTVLAISALVQAL